MAALTNNSSGNFTTSTTWSLIDTTSFLDTKVSTTNTTTAYSASPAFTPGAITVDGIGLQIFGRIAVPVGTFSVRLAQAGVLVAGTEVTVNVADIPTTINGWVFFKFPAPVTLAAATAYTVDCKSTSANAVVIFRVTTPGNWSKYLRTTTNQAPAAGDSLFVVGENVSPGVFNTLTVTMDNTVATVFGSIRMSGYGKLVSDTVASTAYKLITNTNLNIDGKGTLEIGDSVAPIPASSSFTLQINQGGVNVARGIIMTSDSEFRTYGAAKLNRAYLAVDAAVSATSLTTDVSTGWISGEEVVIAPTTATATQLEVRTLSANASGTTLTVPALTFAHQGTGDFVGEIANITRNIKILSDSASFGTYIVNSGASVVDFNYTEFSGMGSSTAGKRGFDVSTTTGSLNVMGCSFHRFQTSAIAFLLNQPLNNNINFVDNVFYNVGTAIQTNVNGLGGNWTVDTQWMFNSQSIFSIAQGTITNLMSAGSGTGITFSNTSNVGLTVSNITAHSCSAAGIGISCSTLQGQTFSNLVTWRNLRAINTGSSSNVTISGHTSYGNTFSGISVAGCANLTVENGVYYGSTSIVQPAGLVLEGTALNTVFNSCTFGVPSVHSSVDVNYSTARAWHDVKFNNCLFGTAAEFGGQANMAQNVYIGSSKHDQTNGVHKGWKRTAVITSDSVIQATAPLSVRITPSVSTAKTISSQKGFAIPTGKTATVSVLVRRSVAGDGTAYNGALPRLWLRQNSSAGVTTDTLLATATAASLGAFEALLGTIPASTDDTVNYLYVDCDGTAGWVNIDKWSLLIDNGAANNTNINTEDFWNDGFSYPGVNTTLTNNTSSETYWIDGKPVEQLYPTSAIQTGRFFLLFE